MLVAAFGAAFCAGQNSGGLRFSASAAAPYIPITTTNEMTDKIISAFLGLAIGDALGVPVEFKSREEIAQNPVSDMLAFGTHQQPAGTWSDDGALAFCLAASLCQKYDIDDIAKNFVLWYDYGFWAAHNEVFDVGIATAQAIQRLKNGTPALLAGNTEEKSNGNGSLMRILPLAFYIQQHDMKTRFQYVSDVSAITHRHIRSVLACFIYVEFALELLKGHNKQQAYANMQENVHRFLAENPVCDEAEKHRFHRILGGILPNCEVDEISSSGYVLDTLEASIWCFLKYEGYAEIVLNAVNLGKDTDTTGCVAGGLAGLYYGAENISQKWINRLAKKDDIIALAQQLAAKCSR